MNQESEYDDEIESYLLLLNRELAIEISSFEPLFANRLLRVVIKYSRKKEF